MTCRSFCANISFCSMQHAGLLSMEYAKVGAYYLIGIGSIHSFSGNKLFAMCQVLCKLISESCTLSHSSRWSPFLGSTGALHYQSFTCVQDGLRACAEFPSCQVLPDTSWVFHGVCAVCCSLSLITSFYVRGGVHFHRLSVVEPKIKRG